jgi:putative DNA-invertase from lambdoid prophage Rac
LEIASSGWSLTEALDLTTLTGRAMAGMLAVFAEFEREVLGERVGAGIAQARWEGRRHGRPRTASLKADVVLGNKQATPISTRAGS